MTSILRWVELDAGHRVPDHGSKCRNPHGHRYRVELTVTGPVINERGNPEDGMVIDFGRLAVALNEVVHDVCDHAFMVADHDGPMRAALADLEDSKIVVVPGPPTAEVLAAWWGRQLADWLLPHVIQVESVTVWETPKSSATWSP